jgi:hypothetical protein
MEAGSGRRGLEADREGLGQKDVTTQYKILASRVAS